MPTDFSCSVGIFVFAGFISGLSRMRKHARQIVDKVSDLQTLKKPCSSRATAFGKRDQPPGNFQFPRRAAETCAYALRFRCVQDKEARLQMKAHTRVAVALLPSARCRPLQSFALRPVRKRV